VAFIALGEGWHNYHHAFPWDYKADEFGLHFNVTCTLIDLLAKYGAIYGRREASADMVREAQNKYSKGSKSMNPAR
jgi:stearoyl-CoA desaturase (Delta-9 desaturase)